MRPQDRGNFAIIEQLLGEVHQCSLSAWPVSLLWWIFDVESDNTIIEILYPMEVTPDGLPQMHKLAEILQHPLAGNS